MNSRCDCRTWKEDVLFIQKNSQRNSDQSVDSQNHSDCPCERGRSYSLCRRSASRLKYLELQEDSDTFGLFPGELWCWTDFGDTDTSTDALWVSAELLL